MHTIRLFMWGYQAHFQISARVGAKSIFNKLDKNLKPNVFLVGILFEDRQSSYPVCVEPENCGYDPDLFSDVKKQAQHLEAIDEERFLLHSHPIAQKNHERRLKLRALKNAIQGVINREDEYRGLVSFCSWPVLVQGYMVCTALQFERDAFNSHYSLVKNRVDDGYAISTSLLDATISEYLDRSSNALTKPDPGSGLDILDRDHDEIIRAAGNRLMYTPAGAGGEFEGLHGLFHACNTISSLRYEGAEGIGKMLIARRGHPNIEIIITLSSPVPMRDYRAVRKLLEMSLNEISLLSDSGYIYGLGRLVGSYDQKAEDLFLINFTKHYTWELLHVDHVMMRVAYGQPQLPRMQIDKEKFKKDIRRIFGDIESKKIEGLWELVVEATQQKHGTMVVVSIMAHKEAERLEKQCTMIEPVQLTPQIMRMITAIDGAVLMDLNSTCYAIGVILDGIASQKGTSSRGARYNSAIRYVETSQYPCIAIVVSADGSIDLVPDLMPQIPRSEISEALSKLRNLRDAKSVNVKEFNKVMSWLSDHRFYILPEVCDEINSLKREVEVLVDNDATFRIVYLDFIPNEEMNDSYFLRTERGFYH